MQFSADVRQLVLIVVDFRSVTIDDQLLLLQASQQFFQHAEWQFDLVGDLSTLNIAARQQRLENEFLDLSLCQPRLTVVPRLRR